MPHRRRPRHRAQRQVTEPRASHDPRPTLHRLTLRSALRTAQRAVPTLQSADAQFGRDAAPAASPSPSAASGDGTTRIARSTPHIAPPDASLGAADGAARRPYLYLPP